MSRPRLSSGLLLRLVRDVRRDQAAMEAHATELEAMAGALRTEQPRGVAVVLVLRRD